MNEGLFGFHKRDKRHLGSVIAGVDVRDPDYANLSNCPVIENASPQLKRRFPKLTFTEYTTPFYVRSIVWAGTKWVAIGHTQSSTSTDLVTWTTPVNLPAKGSGNTWAQIGWNGSQLVVVSEPYPVLGSTTTYTGYSSDVGASWSSGSTITLASNGQPTNKIAWTGSAWLFTIRTETGVFRSTDGINWSKVNAAQFGPQAFGVITNGSGTAFLTTQNADPMCAYSTDHGATWSFRRGPGMTMVYDPYISKFVMQNSYASINPGISTSSDGLTWSVSAPLASSSFVPTIEAGKLAATSSYYVHLIGSNTVIYLRSKHPDDVHMAASGPYDTSLLFKTYYQGVIHENNTTVFFPNIVENFNLAPETYNIGVLTINPEICAIPFASEGSEPASTLYIKQR